MSPLTLSLEAALDAAGVDEVAGLCMRYRGDARRLLDALAARARDSQAWTEILLFAERESVQALDAAVGELYVF